MSGEERGEIQYNIMLRHILLAAISAMALAFPSLSLPKLVMLDRDGVINEDVGYPGVICKEDFQLTPGAATAIGKLKRSGCRVVITTNQACVGRGLLALSGLEEIHGRMERLLREQDDGAVIDRIYICTSVDKKDPRKKPNPGMVVEACSDFQVDPADSIFIGDTLTDLQAAKSGGVQRRILVETGYGFGLMGGESACIPANVVEEIDIETGSSSSHQMNRVTPFMYAVNLAEAVSSIVGE